MNRLLLTFLLAFVATASLARANAQDVLQTDDGFFLPAIEEMAHADGDKIFSVCEIYNGESRTAVVRPSIRCHNTYSIAKLFTVAALGVMEDKGILDIDEPIYPILKDYFPEDFDQKWRDVKISDAITHRAGLGFDCIDIDNNDSSEWPRDFLGILLSTELEYAPGGTDVYTDAVFYLAARVAAEKSGEKLSDFMVRELLEPMKFKEYAFSTDPEGHPIAGTGMYIATDDMAKLGLLFVQDGVYEGKQLLSKRFVDEAFERTFELYPFGDEGVVFAKGGFLGQLLYMNRKTKRVVAVSSYDGNVNEILEFLLEHDK